MNRVVCAIIISICMLFLLGAAPLPPSEQKYLTDPSGIVSPEDGEAILQNASRLFEDTGVEAVVAAVENLNGLEPAVYMADIVDGWSLGGDLGDSYVLLVFSRSDKMAWIAAGSRLRSDLTSRKLQDEIADGVLLPYIQQGDFSKALLEGQRALVLAVYDAFDSKPGESVPASEKTVSSQQEQQTMRAIVIVGSLVIIIRSFYVSHKARERYNKSYGKGSVTKRKRFARQIADIEYTYQDKQDAPATSPQDDDQAQ